MQSQVTAHHPSTGELAAFRRDVATAHRIPDADWHYVPRHGGAWDDEREDGIGQSSYLPQSFPTASRHSDSRREAASQRSRSYSIPRGKVACVALWQDAWAFAPGSFPSPAIVASDSWSEDDEPSRPLPVRYQPAVVRVEDVTERDERDIGLCPCGHGYMGHQVTEHDPTGRLCALAGRFVDDPRRYSIQEVCHPCVLAAMAERSGR